MNSSAMKLIVSFPMGSHRPVDLGMIVIGQSI